MRSRFSNPVTFDKISNRNYNKFCILTYFLWRNKLVNTLIRERYLILPLPANKVAFGDQPLSPDLMDSLFKMIRSKKKPFQGLFRAESGTKQLFFFILESDPYAATLLEEETVRALSIRDFFLALNGMNRPALSLYAANPVFIKCLLVYSQKTPATQGTTALIDIEVLLRQLQTEREDTMLVLRKGNEVNFFYFLKGKLEELYFANPTAVLKEGSLEDQLLVYAFSGSKDTPIGVSVYKDLAALPAEDTDVAWEELPGGMVDYFLRPRPELNVMKGGETIEKRVLQKRRCTIGRGETNDLTVNDGIASREHAVLEEKGGRFYIEDRKSKNGTLLNGQRITSHILSDGDEIRIGEYRMLFVEKQEQASKKVGGPIADLDTTMVVSNDSIQALKPAASRPKPLVLEVVSGNEAGKIFELSQKMILGRSKADIPLKDEKVSRQHASIEETAEGYLYHDLNSMNGSFINGAPTQSKLLVAGDVITIGECMIRVIEKPQ
jgi:pSer/pThr/pTyr-binding forkhead associated (FHA) protein